MIKFSKYDESLETKRGITIGSNISDVIEAYHDYFCFTAAYDSRGDAPRKYTKSHEAGLFFEQIKRKCVFQYSDCRYFIEYDYYMLGDVALSIAELEDFLDENGLTYNEYIYHAHKYAFDITRRYIRIYFKEDKVEDIWIFFSHN